MNNTLLRLSTRASIASAALLAPLTAFAQLDNDNLDEIGGALGSTGGATLPVLIGRGINVLLGVLGIVFVVLVVYAGFLYLTDQGEGKNVAKAKTLLTNSVIGIVIIVAAYAIANFVIDALVGVTGA